MHQHRFVPHASWKGLEDLACKKLLVAILERAILDIAPTGLTTRSHNRNYASLISQQAKLWINDPTYIPKGDLNSYERICALIGIDPAHLRKPEILEKAVVYFQKTLKERKDSASRTYLRGGRSG